MLGDTKLCSIYAYLLTLNLPSSREYYQEILDVVHNIIDSYSRSHKIVFLDGDLNGSLLQTRSNPHDAMLKAYVVEHCLHPDPGVGLNLHFTATVVRHPR